MKVGVTWKLIWSYTIGVALLLMIALLGSCGTRKVATEKSKDIVKEKVEERSTGSVSKNSNNSEDVSDKEENKDVQDNLTKRVEELYWGNGVLKSRITTLEKSKSDKTSTNERKSIKTAKNTIDSVFNNNTYRNVVITTTSKIKNVDSDTSWLKNIGIGGILGMTLIIGGLIFLYFYLNKKKNGITKG